jgi:tetratricopeptide (TPR) repeat protein
LGNIYLDKRRSEERDKAIEYYQKSIEADANQSSFYNGLGNAYFIYNADHPDFAYVAPTATPGSVPKLKQVRVMKVPPPYSSAFQIGTHRLPSFIRDHYWHSWSQPNRPEWYRFNPNEVIRQYQKAINLDSKLGVAHNGLGNVYVELKRYDEAVAHYQRAIELEPLWPHPQHGLGDVYFHQRRFQEALTFYQKSIALDPKLAQSYYQAGLTYLELKNKKAARTQHEKLLTLDPQLARDLSSRL